MTKATVELLAPCDSEHSADFWAGKIRLALARSIESILETGRMLIEAKEKLEHGEWGRMFKEGLVPFSERTAQRLMAVAEHPALSNPTHASLLPSSWYTLYQLSRVPEPKLKKALVDGIITPDMPRKAVAALMEKREEEPGGPFDTTLDDLTRELRLFFERLFEKWPAENIDLLVAQLRCLAEDAEARSGHD